VPVAASLREARGWGVKVGHLRLIIAWPFPSDVAVYSGDGGLFAIGGNRFVHAARRNMDLKVVCVNRPHGTGNGKN
jgi:pyruvate/2-oxoacid:ferredoxin oxidoreductase beta subunit